MRLIDADALEREGWSLCRTFQKDKDTIVYEMKKPSDFPTIEERKKGKWERNDNGTWSCNQCQTWIPDEQHYYANWCLYCGADMREPEDIPMEYFESGGK